MFSSLIPNNVSLGATLFAIFLEMVMVLWVMRVRKFPHVLPGKAYTIALFFCLSYYLLCMRGGDYFTYKENVEQSGYTLLSLYSSEDFHLEIPYVALINFVNNNYLFFRLIVWGGAMLLYCLTARRLQNDRSTFVFYLCVFIAPFTSTSRIALAIGVAMYGFSFIVNPLKHSKVLSYAIGALLYVSSIWLHRSAPFYLIMLPLSLLKLDRKTLLLAFISVPIVVAVIKTGLFDYIFSMETSAEDSFLDARTAKIYLEGDYSQLASKGPGELLRLLFSYLTYFYILVLFVKKIWDGTYKSFPSHIQKYINMTVFVIIVSFILLIMPGANTYKTFERLIALSIVPSAFVLSYFLKNNMDMKYVNKINTFILCWVIYGAVYSLYVDIAQ